MKHPAPGFQPHSALAGIRVYQLKTSLSFLLLILPFKQINFKSIHFIKTLKSKNNLIKSYKILLTQFTNVIKSKATAKFEESLQFFNTVKFEETKDGNTLKVLNGINGKIRDKINIYIF